MVNATISPLVAKTPAALAAATLNAQAPMNASATLGATSLVKPAIQQAQPGAFASSLAATNAANAAKAAILMAPTQTPVAMTNAMRTAPISAFAAKPSAAVLQQRTAAQVQPLMQASQQAQPNAQAQLKHQTSPIVIQKQAISTQPVTTTMPPAPAGAQALMRAQLTQSSPLIPSTYAPRTAQTIVTQPAVARPAATQQMVHFLFSLHPLYCTRLLSIPS